MRKKIGVLVLFTLGLCACGEKPLQTQIAGLDLGKEQGIQYFRAHYELSREFNDWCLKKMIDPIPKDATSQLFYMNCQTVNRAVMSPQESIEKQRNYKGY